MSLIRSVEMTRRTTRVESALIGTVAGTMAFALCLGLGLLWSNLTAQSPAQLPQFSPRSQLSQPTQPCALIYESNGEHAQPTQPCVLGSANSTAAVPTFSNAVCDGTCSDNTGMIIATGPLVEITFAGVVDGPERRTCLVTGATASAPISIRYSTTWLQIGAQTGERYMYHCAPSYEAHPPHQP
jgi:hypothetical protein